MIGISTFKKRRYFVLIFSMMILLFICTLFFPKDTVTLQSLKMKFSSGNSVIIYGNSVIDATSNCDNNRSSIAKMLQIQSGREVINLSRGGQSLDFSLGNAGLLLSKHSRDIVVPISLFQFNSSNSYPVWTALLFQLASGGLEISSLSSRVKAGAYISGVVPLSQKSFVYKKREYPEYARLSAIYFSREKTALTCPNQLGEDLEFIEANYYKSYLLPPSQKQYFIDIKNIYDLAQQRGNRIIYVLLPIDFEDLNTLNPKLANDIQGRLQMTRKSLDDTEVPYLDLSESLPATAFTDRFCACGHLNQNGRSFVAAQISSILAGAK